VFRHISISNPEIEQLKASLAAKIIGVLDGQNISVRRAHETTGFAAADFSRVRQGGAARQFHRDAGGQDVALASRKALWQHPRHDRVPHPFR
jgi:hypothetical protein